MLRIKYPDDDDHEHEHEIATKNTREPYVEIPKSF